MADQWIVATPLLLYLRHNMVIIQDLLICVEMTALSLVHLYAFTTKPYKVVSHKYMYI